MELYIDCKEETERGLKFKDYPGFYAVLPEPRYTINFIIEVFFNYSLHSARKLLFTARFIESDLHNEYLLIEMIKKQLKQPPEIEFSAIVVPEPPYEISMEFTERAKEILNFLKLDKSKLLSQIVA